MHMCTTQPCTPLLLEAADKDDSASFGVNREGALEPCDWVLLKARGLLMTDGHGSDPIALQIHIDPS